MSDVAVVGGGSAGCVLAARLSEDPNREVLLLEAGPDYPSTPELPAEVADGWNVADSHDWGYTSEVDDRSGRSLNLLRGRLMGGCSSLNATFALRGCPADYDDWAAAGNAGWRFAEVLPYFCRLERDLDFGSDAWHGDAGPLPIRRYPADELNEYSRRFLDAAVGEYGEVADHNRPDAIGAGAAPMNTLDRLRMSTAVSYLGPARTRPNLEVRASSPVDRVRLEGGRARGVVLADGSSVNAETVVLTAGAYGSPSILLRSGIGPPNDLRAVEVDARVALPGVGGNLIDHPIASVDLPLDVPAVDLPRYQTMVTWRSARAKADSAYDMHLFSSGPFADEGGAVGALVFSVLKPRSRGWLRLRSADPNAAPRIDLAHLRDPDDLARMVEGVRAARRLAAAPPLAEITVGAGAIAGDDGDDEAWLRARVDTYHHPVGTCAMGADPDAGAVVDAEGSVHGVPGLIVADASIMPDIPAANTNLATIMLAERIAALLARPSGGAG